MNNNIDEDTKELLNSIKEHVQETVLKREKAIEEKRRIREEERKKELEEGRKRLCQAINNNSSILNKSIFEYYVREMISFVTNIKVKAVIKNISVQEYLEDVELEGLDKKYIISYENILRLEKDEAYKPSYFINRFKRTTSIFYDEKEKEDSDRSWFDDENEIDDEDTGMYNDSIYEILAYETATDDLYFKILLEKVYNYLLEDDVYDNLYFYSQKCEKGYESMLGHVDINYFHTLGMPVETDDDAVYFRATYEFMNNFINQLADGNIQSPYLDEKLIEEAKTSIQCIDILAEYIKNQERNNKMISLDICKRLINSYKNAVNDVTDTSDFETVIDVIANENAIKETLGQKEFTFFDNMRQLYKYIIYYPIKQKNKVKYVPIEYSDLEDLVSEFISSINERTYTLIATRNKFTITTNILDFESLILEANKEEEEKSNGK